jgi:hypothetical protein
VPALGGFNDNIKYKVGDGVSRQNNGQSDNRGYHGFLAVEIFSSLPAEVILLKPL